MRRYRYIVNVFIGVHHMHNRKRKAIDAKKHAINAKIYYKKAIKIYNMCWECKVLCCVILFEVLY